MRQWEATETNAQQRMSGRLVRMAVRWVPLPAPRMPAGPRHRLPERRMGPVRVVLDALNPHAPALSPGTLPGDATQCNAVPLGAHVCLVGAPNPHALALVTARPCAMLCSAVQCSHSQVSSLEVT